MNAEELTYEQIEERLEQVLNAEGQVSEASLAAALTLPPEVLEEDNLAGRLYRVIAARDDLFEDPEEKIWYSKEKFFNGKTFVITPGDFEIENNLLLPGHRFAPFMALDNFPSAAVLKIDDKEYTAEKVIEADPAELIEHYILLGSSQFVDYFIAEDPRNEAVLLGGDGERRQKLFFAAWDLTEFYARHKFSSGDGLLIRILDFQQGKFAVSYLDSTARRENEVRKWVASYGAALEEVLAQFDDELEIVEQLQYGFFRGGEGLFQELAASLDEFIERNTSIEIAIDDSGESILISRKQLEEEEFSGDCHCHDHHESCHCHDHGHHHHEVDGHCACDDDCNNEETDWQEDFLPEQLLRSGGHVATLGGIVKELGLSLTEAEIDGYLLDQLNAMDRNYDGFFSRCFGERTLTFVDEAQEVVFHNLLEEKWEVALENYDRAGDESKAPLRSQILELTDERMAFFDTFTEENLSGMPQEVLEELATGTLALSQLLALLNAPGQELDASEVEKIADAIDRAGVKQEMLLEKLSGEC